MRNSQSLIFDNRKLSDIVTHGMQLLGVALPPGADAVFEAYYEFLEKRGRSVNLTAITGAEDVARLHFLDSIALLNAVKFSGARVIDIGSGAGFPGLPLMITEPSICLTLLDATGKRVAFLSELCEVLNLNVACIHARAEESAHKHDMREQYDIAVSRAVARLNVICELCLPFVRIGGMFIAMKSADSADELAEALSAIETLGAKLSHCYDYTIPGTGIIHRAVIVVKNLSTPEKYPRRFSRIQKSPL